MKWESERDSGERETLVVNGECNGSVKSKGAEWGEEAEEV